MSYPLTAAMLTAIGNTLAAQEDRTLDQVADQLTIDLVRQWGGAWGIRDAVSGRYGYGQRGWYSIDESRRPRRGPMHESAQ